MFFGQTANPSVHFTKGNENLLDKDLYYLKKGDIIIDP